MAALTSFHGAIKCGAATVSENETSTARICNNTRTVCYCL